VHVFTASPDDADPEEALAAGAVDAPSVAGAEEAESGEPERVSEALGEPEGDPAAPAPPPLGWHPVTIRAAEAATIASTLLRMLFLYCMMSPENGSHMAPVLTDPRRCRQSRRAWGSLGRSPVTQQ
jgi:hypothetical protein